MCDSKEGFHKSIEEDEDVSPYYEFVEEMPNKNQIISIIKEVSGIYDNIAINWISRNLSNTMESNYIEKFLVLISKATKILTCLSKNFYGQTILLYSDYPINLNSNTSEHLPKLGKPLVQLNILIDFITERLCDVKKTT